MKRFTETGKWADPWFMGLGLDAKLAFWFITENCDGAGVWDPNFRLANFVFGRDIDWDAVRHELGSRLEVLPCGKWWLTKFVGFQCGNLSSECPPHKKIIELLKKAGLIERVAVVYPNSNNRPKGRLTLQEEEEEEEGIRKGDQRGKPLSKNDPAIAAIYQAYPRKVAKPAALKAIRKAIAAIPPGELLDRTKAFAQAVAKWPDTDLMFVPHPATWFNQERFNDGPDTWSRDAGTPRADQDAEIQAARARVNRQIEEREADERRKNERKAAAS